MTPEERAKLRRSLEGMSKATEEMVRALQRLYFTVLDRLADDADPPRSWEVEREDFVRRMEKRDL